MSNYLAKDYFADWYKEADKNSDSATNTKRIQSINSLVKNDNKDFWLDIARFSLGRKIQNQANIEKFIHEFKIKDDTFPLLNNQNLIRVLSAISLCFKLEKQRTATADLLSFTLNNNNFFKPSPPTIAPFFEYAANYKESDDTREIIDSNIDVSEIETLEENLKLEESALDKKDFQPIINAVKNTAYTISILQEESNILWWIFGEYSSISKKSFKETGGFNISATSARELCNITKFRFEFSSAKSILKKVVTLASNDKESSKERSIYEIINDIDPSYKAPILDFGDKIITDVTPFLYAMKVSLEYLKTDSWQDSFNTKYSIDLSKKVSLSDFAYQIYNECLFMDIL